MSRRRLAARAALLRRRSPLPTFLIIGAQKSATRWLRINLGEHPQVFTAPSELAFFSSHRFDEGLERYREGFEGWSGEPVVGEATPAYMMWRTGPERTAARIANALPGVRLIALLRDPVERAFSAFIHHMRRGRIAPDADFLARLRDPPPERDELGLVSGGWYAASLAPYVTGFGDRLAVLLHDDALTAPEAVYARALRHIDAQPGFRPPDLGGVRHSGTPPAGSPHAAADGARRALMGDERVAAYAYFADDVTRLESMLGSDLSRWRHA